MVIFRPSRGAKEGAVGRQGYVRGGPSLLPTASDRPIIDPRTATGKLHRNDSHRCDYSTRNPRAGGYL